MVFAFALSDQMAGMLKTESTPCFATYSIGLAVRVNVFERSFGCGKKMVANGGCCRG